MDKFVVNIIHRPEMVPEYSATVTGQGKEEDIGDKALITESLDIFKTQQRLAHENGLKCTIQMTYSSLFNEEAVELAKKYDIETEIIEDGIESGITDFNGEQFKFIEKAVQAVFPEYKAVPYIMNGATDSRYFTRVCDNCIRFVPFKIDNQQYGSVHGIDENVDIDTLPIAVDFYKYVIKEV